MAKYYNLKLIGTSHIAKESLTKVKKEIINSRPDIIAIELDNARFRSLQTKKKSIVPALKRFGIKGFILNLLGAYIEKLLSKETGITPGSEMKQAIILAEKLKIKIALIDQPIEQTIKRLLSRITRKEKYQFFKDLFQTVFVKKKQIQFDLNKVPTEATLKELMEETKTKYPNVYKALVTERDIYMGKALYKLMSTFPDKKILAIVGAGHENGIMGELKSMKK